MARTAGISRPRRNAARGDGELMNSKTKALLDAIAEAEDCRQSDPNGQRICGPCWAKVGDAVKVINPKSFEVLFG